MLVTRQAETGRKGKQWEGKKWFQKSDAVKLRGKWSI